MYLLIIPLVLVACALAGVWIVHARARSTALGIGLGIAGPIGYFTLSALPTLPSEAAHRSREAEIARAEDRGVRVLYQPPLLTWVLLGLIGLAAHVSPATMGLLIK
jgi:hypothetical protein